MKERLLNAYFEETKYVNLAFCLFTLNIFLSARNISCDSVLLSYFFDLRGLYATLP